MKDLTDQQLLRYSRQILLNDWDVAGQQRLLASRVLVVGAGGLGSPVMLYLAAAGVGQLVIADGDQVELSNLQRQIAHGEADIGESKAVSAAAAAREINSDCQIEVVAERLQAAQLLDRIAGVDAVVDCSDNFATRFAINRACFAAGVPLISGAAIRTEGQLAVFDPRAEDSPCYRCLYSEDADDSGLNCADAGVLAPFVGVIGSLQALLAVNLLAGFGAPAHGRLTVVDGRDLQLRTLTLPPDPQCPVCAQRD